MTKGYYRQIDGKKYKDTLLLLADSMVDGQGNGRISFEDAKELIEFVMDGGVYTDIEKATIKYIRDNYRFTNKADKWFRTEIRSWAATK